MPNLKLLELIARSVFLKICCNSKISSIRSIAILPSCLQFFHNDKSATTTMNFFQKPQTSISQGKDAQNLSNISLQKALIQKCQKKIIFIFIFIFKFNKSQYLFLSNWVIVILTTIHCILVYILRLLMCFIWFIFRCLLVSVPCI